MGPDHGNRFDLLRLASTFLVLISHSWVLTGGTDPFDPLLQNQIGTMGVYMFFGISGFLITQSWMLDPRPRAFAIKRALRILPAIVICAFITAFVLGPLVTTMPVGDYLTNSQPYLFVVKTFALVTFNPFLPGVFHDVPFPDTVNGSLWTIPLEAFCYVLIASAGVLGVLKRPRILVWIFVAALIALAIAAPAESPTGKAPGGVDVFMNAVRVGTAFLCGVLIYQYRPRLPQSQLLVTVLLLVGITAPLPTGLHSMVCVIVCPLWVLVVGLKAPGRLATSVTRMGDISYGSYVYAFPIQQLLALEIPGLRAVPMLLLTALIVYPVGYASWRLVEQPTLRQKKRLTRRFASRGAAVHAPAIGLGETALAAERSA